MFMWRADLFTNQMNLVIPLKQVEAGVLYTDLSDATVKDALSALRVKYVVMIKAKLMRLKVQMVQYRQLKHSELLCLGVAIN